MPDSRIEPPPPLFASALARATDPETSKAAARAIIPHLSKLHAWTTECVQKSPGKTSRELAALYCPTDPRTINRRLGECEARQSVIRGAERACTISGRMAETWWPK